MFERFSAWGRQVMVHAQEEARELRHGSIGTEHLLLALLREPGAAGARGLAGVGIAYDETREVVTRIVGTGDRVTAGQIPFTPRAKNVLEQAMREAMSLGHDYIGTEHLLLGLARDGEGVAAQILAERHIDLRRIRDEVMNVLHGGGGDAPATDERSNAASVAAEAPSERLAERRSLSPWDPVSGAHLLLGLVAAGGPVADFLSEHGVTAQTVRARFEDPE
jgi:ATP-dependent Clp protease ATP-binding subunit ClpC